MTLDDKKICNEDNNLPLIKSDLLGMEQLAADFHSDCHMKIAREIRLLIDDINNLNKIVQENHRTLLNVRTIIG